ncbi:MAG: hypothetical protein LBN33_00660 [Desulfovibrio sp.]|nr:hypothetical protein [Desulfovibrio sp.]
MRKSLEKLSGLGKLLPVGLILGLILSLGLICAFGAPSVRAKDLAVDRVSAPQSLLPFFAWTTDPKGKQGIQFVSSTVCQDRFVPFEGMMPLKGGGPLWIRLTLVRGQQPGLSALPAPARSRLVMRLGQLPPGGAEVFFPEAAASLSSTETWRGAHINSLEEMRLPEPGLLPLNVYIRLQEMPGLWFAPLVSSLDAVDTDLLPSELLLPGIIIAALLVCFLRAIADRAQWALWAAFFLGCVLVQSRLSLPPQGQIPSPVDLPPLLAPGLSLFLLPHVGRSMLTAGENLSWRKNIFFLCSVLGVALVLAPLLPGLPWAPRLFPVWPLLLIPLLPVCFSALTAKESGALAFCGAVIMPVLGAVLALCALQYPNIHPLAAQGALWGLAVGGLGLTLARIPKRARVEVNEISVNEVEANETGADSALQIGIEPFSSLSAQSQHNALPPVEVTISGGQLPDAVAEKAAPKGASEEEDIPVEHEADGEEAKAPVAARDTNFSEKEKNLSELPDEVMDILEGGASGDNSFVFNLLSLVREVHDMVLPLAKSRGLIFSWYIAPVCPSLLIGDAPRLRGALTLLLQNAVQACSSGLVRLSVRPAVGGSGEGDLLFSVSDSGAAKRTDAGFFMAWELAARSGGSFTIDYSPQVGTRIAFTAHFALPAEDGAESGPDGYVQSELDFRGDKGLAARFADAGDDDEPMPVLHSVSMESKAQAGEDESSPESRAVFAGPWTASLDMEKEAAGTGFAQKPDAVAEMPGVNTGADLPDCPRILLADMTSASRRIISIYLDDLPHENLKSSINAQVLDIFRASPPALIIFDADMPESDIARAISVLRMDEEAGGRSPVPVLVIAGHSDQAERLLKAGASHSLGKPFSREALRETVGNAVPALAPLILTDKPEAEENEEGQKAASGPENGWEQGDPTPATETGKSVSTDIRETIEIVPAAATEKEQSFTAPKTGLPIHTDPGYVQNLALNLAATEHAPRPREFFREPSVSFFNPGLPPFPPLSAKSISLPAQGGAATTPDKSAEAPSLSGPGAFEGPEQQYARNVALQLAATENNKRLRDIFLDPGVCSQRLGPPLAQAGVATTPDKSAEAPSLPGSGTFEGQEQRQARNEAPQRDAAGSNKSFGDPFLDPGLIFLKPGQPQAQPWTAPDSVSDSVAGQAATALIAHSDSASGDVRTDPGRTGKSRFKISPVQRAPAASGDAKTEPARTNKIKFKPAAAPAQPTAAPVPPRRPIGPSIQPKLIADFVPAASAQPQSVSAPARAQPVVTPSQAKPATPVQLRRIGPSIAPKPIAGFVPAAPAQPTAVSVPPLRSIGPSIAPKLVSAPAQAQPVVTPSQAKPATPVQGRRIGPSIAPKPIAGFVPAAPAQPTAVSVPPLRSIGPSITPKPISAPVQPQAVSGVRAEEGFSSAASALSAAEAPAAPMIMGLSADDVIPQEHAQDGSAGGKEDPPIFVLDDIREDDPVFPTASERQKPKTEREDAWSGYAKSPAPGSLLDFVLPGPDEEEGGEEDKALEAKVGMSLDKPPVKETAVTPEKVPKRDSGAEGDAQVNSPAASAPGTSERKFFTLPLPGIEGESIENTALPLVPGLVDSLGSAARDAEEGLVKKHTVLVQEAAARLAGKAENFGLVKLGKLSRCLERAAEADDAEAAGILLEELQLAVSRYEKALLDCFNSFVDYGR